MMCNRIRPGLPASNAWKRIVRMAAVFACLTAFGCVTPQEGGISTQGAGTPAAVKGSATKDVSVLPPKEALPEGLLKSAHHRVVMPAAGDGYANIYTVESDYGSFRCFGNGMLAQRVAEIRAMNSIDELKREKFYSDAAAEAGNIPLVRPWNPVLHPADSLSGMPDGLLRRMLDGEGSSGDKFRALKDRISSLKRRIAYGLGADCYTSNPALQRRLNALAWAAYAGKTAPEEIVTGISGETIEGIEAGPFDDAVRMAVRDFPPDELRAVNERKLMQMGVGRALIEAFLFHPDYSPSIATALVHALVSLEEARNINAFIDSAVTAESENDAFFFLRTAELIRGYDKRVSRIALLMVLENTIACATRNRALVVPLAADYGAAEESLTDKLEAVARSVPITLGVENRELLVSGLLSDAVKTKILAMGWKVTEDAVTGFREAMEK